MLGSCIHNLPKEPVCLVVHSQIIKLSSTDKLLQDNNRTEIQTLTLLNTSLKWTKSKKEIFKYFIAKWVCTVFHNY